MTPLAWLRNFEEALTAANINGLLERLRYVRGMGIDASVSRAIPDFRFTQFVRQGGVAPAFLLSDYRINRRRATLPAAAIDLDVTLADATLHMFDRRIGGRFTPSRRVRARRHQANTHSCGKRMRFSGRPSPSLA